MGQLEDGTGQHNSGQHWQETVGQMDLHKGLKNSNIWNIEWPETYQGTQYGLWSSEQQAETRQVEHWVFPLFENS